MSIQIGNEFENISTLVYAGMYIEGVFYDKEFDNYFLYIRELKDDETVSEAIFYGKPSDLAQMVTGKITRDTFLKNCHHKYKVTLEYCDDTDVYHVLDKKLIRNINYYLTNDDCFFCDEFFENNLSLEAYMKYSYVVFSDKGLREFLESLNE